MLIMQVALLPLLEFVTNYDIHNYTWQRKNKKILNLEFHQGSMHIKHRQLALAIFTPKSKLMSKEV